MPAYAQNDIIFILVHFFYFRRSRSVHKNRENFSLYSMYTLRVNVQGPSNPNSNQGYSAILNRVVLYVYSINIFDADVSSFLNKPLHGVLIPFSSCSVQGSSLIVGKRKRSHKINWSECMNDFKCNRQSKCLNLMMDSKSFLLQFDWRLWILYQ